MKTEVAILFIFLFTPSLNKSPKVQRKDIKAIIKEYYYLGFPDGFTAPSEPQMAPVALLPHHCVNQQTVGSSQVTCAGHRECPCGEYCDLVQGRCIKAVCSILVNECSSYGYE